MTPEQMANIVPEPRLAEWLLAKGARITWTIRDAMPSDPRKQRLVQQWTLDGTRFFYVVLYVQPDRPPAWAIAPELGIAGRTPAALAAMDRWLAADPAPAVALAAEILARQRACERMMSTATDQRMVDDIRDGNDRMHASDAVKLAELVHAQIREQGPIPPVDPGQFTADELGMLRVAVRCLMHLATGDEPVRIELQQDKLAAWHELTLKIQNLQARTW